MVAPFLMLEDCFEAMKSSLSSGRPMVALARKRCNGQYLDLGEYASQRYTIYLWAGCGYKWDLAP